MLAYMYMATIQKEVNLGVWNQWNGMVEWTTGMEYRNELGQDPFACI